MTINTDDPRITAYIMDELEGEERAAFERELQACPESQAHLEQMQQTAELLRDELEQEGVLPLSDAQRQRVERSASRPK